MGHHKGAKTLKEKGLYLGYNINPIAQLDELKDLLSIIDILDIDFKGIGANTNTFAEILKRHSKEDVALFINSLSDECKKLYNCDLVSRFLLYPKPKDINLKDCAELFNTMAEIKTLRENGKNNIERNNLLNLPVHSVMDLLKSGLNIKDITKLFKAYKELNWLPSSTNAFRDFQPDMDLSINVLKEVKNTSWAKFSVMRALALPMAIGVVLTAFSGRLINDYLYDKFGSKALLVLFVFVMLFIGFQSLFGKTAQSQNEEPNISKTQSIVALFCGMLVGVISSVLGISGALIFRPIIINGFKITEKHAAQSVRFLLLVATISGSLFYLFAGGNFHHNILLLGVLIALGGAFGFPLGVKYGAIVLKNGYVKILQKSFGNIILIIITNAILNLLDFVTFSRYLMIICALILFIFINLFTLYTAKHPRIQK